VAMPVAPTGAVPQVSAPGAPGGDVVPAVGGPVERVLVADGSEVLLAADQGSAQIAAAAERRPVEIVGRRSEVSSTWAMPNGTLSSRLAAGPLWVRRGGDGTRAADWALVDLTLERRADGSVGPRAHPSAMSLSGARPAAPAGVVAAVDNGRGAKVELGWEGALPAPRLEGPRAVYPQVRPGVDLVVEASRTGFEQFFVLTERPRPGQEADLQVEVRLQGATARQGVDGQVEFVTADGAVLGGVPARTVWDADVDAERLHPLGTPWVGGPGEVSAYPSPELNAAVPPAGPVPAGPAAGPAAPPVPPAAELSPSAVEGAGKGEDGGARAAKASPPRRLPVDARVEPARVSLDVTPDPVFLQDRQVQFPVVVDPEVRFSSTFDTYVQSNIVNTDQSGQTDLRLGTYDGGATKARSFVHVEAALIAGSQVLSSSLDLYAFHSFSCDRRNWRVWHAGVAGTGTRWGNQPPLYGVWSTSDQTRGWGAGCEDGWVSADVRALMQMHADAGGGLLSVGLTAENEQDTAGWKKFNSGNASGAIPNIYVNYQPGCTAYESSATGRHYVCGEIRDRYNALGGPNGPLGFPTTGEGVTGDGVGRFNHFQGGTIIWGPSTGAHDVRGAIRDRWAQLGWERSGLGYPTTGEGVTGDGVGRFNHFQGGTIIWGPATGAWDIRGAIRDRWGQLGSERSGLGYPTTGDSRTGDGAGWFNHFQGGTIIWGPSTGAQDVQGAIRDRWAQLGWESGLLGYPTSGQLTAADGAGRFNHFAKDASVFWSPTTGAWEVRQAIRAQWFALGWERGCLGYPTSGDYAITGATRQNFQYGTITYTTATGATSYTCRPPAAVTNLRSTSHGLVVSADRTVDIVWTQPVYSSYPPPAGYSIAWSQEVTAVADATAELPAGRLAATSPPLGDGAWYANIVTVSSAGKVSSNRRVGPLLVGNATLADGLLPTSPVAQSNELGLEQFAPYDQVPLGTASSYVQLRTGNVVTQQDLVSVPGQGLNTVVKLTHNSQQGVRDSGVGSGWSLSVTDLEAGLDGVLAELSDAAVTDIDINRDVVLGQISGGSIVQDLAYLGSQVTGDVLEFVDGDGTTHRFTRAGGPALTGGGRWLSPPGVDLKVRELTRQVVDAAGVTVTIVEAYEFVRPDGVVYVATKQTFAGLALPVWRISSVRDRNGNVLSYTHANFDGVGISKVRLTDVRHNRYPEQSVVRFDYQPYVAGADNTDAGVLRSITSLPGVTVDGRSFERRIDTSISPGAHQLTGWTQNAHTATLDGAPVPAIEQARRSVAYTYNADGSLASASDGNAPGRLTRYTYTAGRPAGTSTSAPTVPMLSSLTDRAGALWRWAYTPLAGNETRTSVTRPVTATSSATSSFTITARGPVSPSDPRVTGGNVRLVSDAGNNTGPVTTTHNWAANKLISTINADGAATSFRYDDLGLLIETTNPAPNLAGSDLPAGAPSTPITNTLSYRAGGSYPNCTDPADDGQPVSGLRSCALFADLTRVVTATGTDSQRVADFDPDPLTGQLRTVAERANPDGTVSAADRTTGFVYYSRGALRSIDGSRTDVADVTSYGDPADPVYGGYDRTGQPLRLTDADGKTKTFSYTPYGMLSITTDRDGRATNSRYDQRDNLLSVTVPGSSSTDYGYDNNNNKTSQSDPARTRDGISYRPVTNTVFDLVDRPVEVRAPGADERPGSSTGKTVSTTGYFADGTVEFTDGPLVGTADRVTHAYWPNRQPKQSTAPAGTGQQALTDTEYDRVGRLVRTVGPAVDAAGNRPVQMSMYTPDGEVARVLRTSPTGPAGNTEQSVSSWFTAHGEVLVTTGPRVVDGLSARQENSYDTFGQQTSSRRLAGRTAAGADRWIVSQSGFDPAGNTIRSTQATGDGAVLESLFRFDALNRLAEQTKDPINPGRQVRYGYNGEGQQTARHDVGSDGSALRSVETFFNNDNTKAAETVTTFDQATPADQRTLSSCNYRQDGTSGFDPDGNLLYTRTVRGPPRAAGTDGCGTAGAVLLREQTSSFDDRNWPGQVSTGARTPAGAMISRTQRMTYHPNGSKASLTHNDGTRDFTTSFAISPAGWEEKVTDWRGRDSTAAYLPSGDISRTTLGASSALPGGSAQAVSGYHVDGSLQALAWTAGGQSVRAHTAIGYDIGGIRTVEQISLRQPGASSDQSGQAGYSYDLLDRLRSYTTAAPYADTETRRASTAYTLDDGGNITREISTVPAEGVKPARTMADQASTYTNGRLTGRVSKQTVADLTDPIDLITTTDTFSYNDLGEENRRTGTEVYAGTLPAPITATTSSTSTTFDAAGHPLSSTNQATKPAGSSPAELDGANTDVDYAYDSADRVLWRTERNGAGSTATSNTTLFFYAAGSGQLLEETDAAGKTKTRYLLDGEGETVGQQTYTINPDGSSAAPAGEKWSWLLNDALGNTGTIIDDLGKVLEQKAFDPHGKPEPGGSKTSTDLGTPKTTIGFQSARTDETTGRVMLGQRQYDPGTARFTTPDSYAAGMLDLQLGTDSLTGNRYLFAGANPMSFYEDGHGPFGRLKKIAKRAMPVLAYVPIVSTAIDVASAATGRDFYNGGRKMTGAERLTILGGAALGLIPGAGIAAKIGLKQAIKATTKAKPVRALANAVEDVRVGARLQRITNQAARDFESGAISMSQRQAAAASKNERLQPMFRGSVIDRQVRARVANDRYLAGRVQGRSNRGPDFHYGDRRSGWFDMTTRGQWGAHQARYGAAYGRGWFINTRPGWLRRLA